MIKLADGKVIIEISGDASGLEKELDKAADSATNLGTVFKGNLLANLATKGIELAADAAAQLGSAFINAAKSSVAAYAEYEQLVGGVETLFKDSAYTVEAYAANAYKTAGMSANAYMETATGFAASLVRGLGDNTAAAAEIANVAITDMSDNANKMGTDIASIQYAYQGFAKQNYTMLDNLKLGYGGTQAEMIQLINDSGILEEEISSMDGITFDQIISAIHEVQTKLGITGTTAEEASSTIEGSLNSAKAAWDNLLTGLADENADMDELITDFAESAGTALDNILPRLETVLEGIGPLISELVPKLAERLPELLAAGGSIVTGLVQGLRAAASTMGDAMPELIGGLVSALPGIAWELLNLGADIVGMVLQGLLAAIDSIFGWLGDIFSPIVDGIKEALAPIGDAIDETFNLDNFGNAMDYAEGWDEVGFMISGEIASGVEDGSEEVESELITNLADLKRSAEAETPAYTDVGENINDALQSGVEDGSSGVTTAVEEVISEAKETAAAETQSFSDEVGAAMAEETAGGIEETSDDVSDSTERAIELAKEAADGLVDEFIDTGSNISKGIASGITAATPFVESAARKAVREAKAAAEAEAGIHSPSSLFRDEVGYYIGAGVAVGIDDSTELIKEAIRGTITAAVGEAKDEIAKLAPSITKQVDALNADIASIEAEQARRQEAKELADYEKALQEKYDKLAEAELDEREAILEDIAKLQADWDEKQLQKQEQAAIERLRAQIKALEDYRDAWDDALGDLFDDFSDTIDSIQKEQEKLSGMLKGTGYLTYENDLGQLRLHDLTKDTAAIKDYGDAMTALRDRGVNSDLWKEILGMDMEDATAFAKKLLGMNDEAYETYLGTYAEKQAAAEAVAEAIFGPVQEAAEQEFMADLPDKLEAIGTDAMASLADSIDADGQLAIDAAAAVADSILAEIERINLSAQLRNAVLAQVAATSDNLAASIGTAQEVEAARAYEQAVQNAVINGVINGQSENRDVVLVIDGKEFARATIDDFRSVEGQSPRIVSD